MHAQLSLSVMVGEFTERYSPRSFPVWAFYCDFLTPEGKNLIFDLIGVESPQGLIPVPLFSWRTHRLQKGGFARHWVSWQKDIEQKWAEGKTCRAKSRRNQEKASGVLSCGVTYMCLLLWEVVCDNTCKLPPTNQAPLSLISGVYRGSAAQARCTSMLALTLRPQLPGAKADTYH